VDVRGVLVGGDKPVVIAGPCAVENEEYVEQLCQLLVERGVRFLRGGAFKPRTSPHTFQGLGMAGVRMLADAARRHKLRTVSELTQPELLEDFAASIDVVQVGARSMYDYHLLTRLAATRHPVLLKRSFGATIEEWLLAAEYLVAGGNPNVILCERGIRTFETATRFSLDISAVALARETTDLPVVADVSHAAGRRDLLLPLARAALAAGADGLMVEVHPCPGAALSDAGQQLDPEGFHRFMDGLEPQLTGKGT